MLRINIQILGLSPPGGFMLLILLLWLGGSLGRAIGQENVKRDFRYYYQQGQQACANNLPTDCLEYFKKANMLRPGHQTIMFRLAQAFSVNGRRDSCIYYLRKTIPITAHIDLKDSAFTVWQKHDKFQGLLLLQQEMQAAVHRSETATVLKERDLHIESIAFHPGKQRFYYGSVHKQKILWSKAGDTVIHNFTDTAQDGLWSVFGMKVDTSRDHLWVCSVATPNMIHQDSLKVERSSVYKYDLNTAKLIKSYPLVDPENNHWFGDLTLNTQGDVYISDSRANAIYRITKQADSLELFLRDNRWISLQGLDFDQHGVNLYLSDYVLGPFKIQMATKSVAPITAKSGNFSLKAIDGLYYHDNSLITTQNQVNPMRVSRYFLNETGDAVIGVEYLEKAQPLLNEPTLGVIHKNQFYYVANSQWGGYDDNHRPKPWDQLQDIHILKVGL